MAYHLSFKQNQQIKSTYGYYMYYGPQGKEKNEPLILDFCGFGEYGVCVNNKHRLRLMRRARRFSAQNP